MQHAIEEDKEEEKVEINDSDDEPMHQVDLVNNIIQDDPPEEQ